MLINEKEFYEAAATLTQGDIQQLREILRKEIAKQQMNAEFDAEDARMYKGISGEEDTVDACWKAHFKHKKKNKKLAKLQTKLKSVQWL